MVGEDEEELSEIDSEEERRRRIMARKPTASHQDQFYPASQFKRKRSSFRMHILPFLAAWNLRQEHSDIRQNILTFKKV